MSAIAIRPPNRSGNGERDSDDLTPRQGARRDGFQRPCARYVLIKMWGSIVDQITMVIVNFGFIAVITRHSMVRAAGEPRHSDMLRKIRRHQTTFVDLPNLG
jgi:hypothetical protein